MIAAFIATFDLTEGSGLDKIRTRLNSNKLHVTHENADLWHLAHENGHHATFLKLGDISNGDTVFFVIMERSGRNYLRNKLGASKVRRLMAAWNDDTVRAVLGGVTIKSWLLNHGFKENGEGLPIPPITFNGISALMLGQRDISE